MGCSHRNQADSLSLIRELAARPYAFELFALLRRLECLAPDGPRLGESTHPRQDPVHLGQTPSLSFAPATIHSFEPRHGDSPARLLVHSFGLLGPNGPLPLHLTEYIFDRLHNRRDPTIARFLDLFHHRMMSFLYRAWADAQPTVSFDRPRQDRFADYVASLFGLGGPALRNRDSLPDLGKLHHAGNLAALTRCPGGLVQLIGNLFRVKSRVLEFVGRWVRLPEADRLRLGNRSPACRLGVFTILGGRIRDCQSNFMLCLENLTYAQYEDFLPGRRGLEQLVACIRNYLGDEFSWQIRLMLLGAEVPGLALGGNQQLGWSTWLPDSRSRPDRQDLVLAQSSWSSDLGKAGTTSVASTEGHGI